MEGRHHERIVSTTDLVEVLPNVAHLGRVEHPVAPDDDDPPRIARAHLLVRHACHTHQIGPRHLVLAAAVRFVEKLEQQPMIPIRVHLRDIRPEPLKYGVPRVFFEFLFVVGVDHHIQSRQR